MKKNIVIYAGALVLLVSIGTIFSCEKDKTTKNGVEFIVGNAAEPASIDPHKVSGVPEHRINLALFEGLVRSNPKTTRAEAGVAESWTIDGSVYTFKIRKNAVWSDGVAITAQTVVDSWFRILNPETASPYAWFPSLFIKGAEAYTAGTAGKDTVAIRALDESTFQFETVGELPYTLDALTHYSFSIVPMHAIEKYGSDWILPKNFVGNGPFVLTEWKPQELLSTKKNDMYWDKEHVYIDSVVFLPTENESTLLSMFQNNEVDWSVGIPLEQYESLRGTLGFHVSSQLATYYYELNQIKAPTDQLKVRQAIARALGRDEIALKVLGQGQTPAYGIVPPIEGYTPPKKIAEDITEAKKLLADAGYPNGKGFPTLTLLYNTNEQHKKIAEFIQQRLKETLNIDIVLENQEWKTYLESRGTQSFDLARAGWVGDYFDPNTFLDLFVTGGALNYPNYSNPEYDALIAKAARTKGPERFSLLSQAEDLLINKDVAIIPIYSYVTFNLIDDTKWEGWYENTMDVHPFIGLKKVK